MVRGKTTRTDRGDERTRSHNSSVQAGFTTVMEDFEKWASLSERSWSSKQTPEIRGSIKDVLLVGMGGSGITGDLVCDIAQEKGSTFRFHALKNYHIPEWVNVDSLVLAVSCSGNTEETISAVSEAKSRGIRCCCFGSGGLLEKLATEKWNFPFLKTEMLHVPRTSFPSLFFSVLRFLFENSLLPLSEEEVRDSIQQIRRTWSLISDVKHNHSLNLAKFIGGRSGIPLIYSSPRTRAVGLRFRQSINENAKMHAFAGEIPELCHNDIVGWDSYVRGQSDPAILLRLTEDDPREVSVRFQAVSSVIQKARGKMMDAPYSGHTYLGRALSMLYFLDLATVYLARIRKVDALKTPSIDLLKSELGTKLNYLASISR